MGRGHKVKVCMCGEIERERKRTKEENALRDTDSKGSFGF